MDENDMKKKFFFNTKSPAYRRALEDCERVAASNVNVLLIGESGSGKDVAAQYIHACSRRSDMPLIAVNCNAYTESLLEAELFGHEQGAFTGAIKGRAGKFELADKSTLFLDEVGDINLTTQVKLLRAIETKRIERIGGNNSKQLDFRLITATNRDLAKEIADGHFREVRNSTFREDFFYRISTIVIRIPALKERKEDLVDMIHFFLEESQRVNQIRIDSIDEKAWDFLINYDYPGNIRELRNHVDRMVVLSKNHVITTEGIPILYNLKTTDDDSPSTAFTQAGIVPWREFKRRSEREYLQWVLNQMGWNISATAYKLGISARQLFNKINEYNLENPQTGRPQKPVHSI